MKLDEIKWKKGEGLEELITWGIQPMQWAIQFLDEGESIYEALPEHYQNELLRIFSFFEKKLEGMEKAIMRFETSMDSCKLSHIEGWSQIIVPKNRNFGK